MQATDVLRANLVGYLADDFKTAVYIGDTPTDQISFALTQDGCPLAIDSVVAVNPWAPFAYSARIYFTSNNQPGACVLSATLPDGTEIASVDTYIGDDAYSRYAMRELPLHYLRQQRCGENPVFGEKCHQHDGYLVLSGDRDGEYIDVRGGWHDASDFLQYLPTSANTVYQLLFAYQQNPQGWADDYDASGRPGANGIPDVLDEARHGLVWMLSMNPEPGLYLNQIADDRDHRFAGLPARDNVDYGWGAGNGRPVYPCLGDSAGLYGNKNNSKGLASSVAKFASAFSLGADIFKNIDPELACQMSTASAEAYDVAYRNPGACQTAPCISPYFYEEDNYADDMELAAILRFRDTGDSKYLWDAVEFGRMEPVTPWMGADSARHYQWYPFVNLGHFAVGESGDAKIKSEFVRNMRSGLQRVAERGSENAFYYGIPFIWCSNNLAVAYVTQGMLYRQLTGDNAYVEAETAVRDWLMGCNPWGQVMMMLPMDMDIPSPSDPHSTIIDLEIQGLPGRHWLTGGLVDGPVYGSIFDSLLGVHLRHDDRHAAFQSPWVVYHDDYSDYSTNEPTMDGTASLAFMLSRLCQAGN